ncbi:MAG: sulfatase-like hydrolase/transferase, partial [Bacteroidota bacterium]
DSFEVASGGSSKKAITDTTYFADEVAYMDRIVGEIIAKVHELNLDQNTLILFTSDNGTGKEVVSQMGDKSISGMKGYTSKYGIHVPFVAYWNGTIAPGQINDNLIDFSDFLTTLAELSGKDLAQDFLTDGISFYPQLTGEDHQPREWIFMHYPGKEGSFEMSRSVFNKQLKLYESGEIYNILSDPYEQNKLNEALLTEAQQSQIDFFSDVIQKMK